MARLYDGPVGPLLRATWAPWQGGGSVQEQVSKVHPGASRGPEPGGAAAVTQWPLTEDRGPARGRECRDVTSAFRQRRRHSGAAGRGGRAALPVHVRWHGCSGVTCWRTGGRVPENLLCSVLSSEGAPTPPQLCNFATKVSPRRRESRLRKAHGTIERK